MHTTKIGTMHLDFSRRIDDLQTSLKKLDKYARRPVDYYDVIDRECKKVLDRCIYDLETQRKILDDNILLDEKRHLKSVEIFKRHKKMYSEIK